VPLQGAQGRAFDLSLIPLSALAGLKLTEGVSSGESGAQSGRLTLALPEVPIGALWRAELSAHTERGAEVSALVGQGEAEGGALAWLSLGGGPSDFTYYDRYGLLRRREGAAYQRASAGLKVEHPLGEGRVRWLAFGALLSRGEPGPEGLEAQRGESAQGQGALSVRWEASRPRVLSLSASFLQRAYTYEEARPLWQSVEEVKHRFKERVALVKASGARWVGRRFEVRLNAEGRYERSEVNSGGEAQGEQQRLRGALTPTLSISLSEDFKLSGAARLDLNTEREAIWAPSASLMWAPTQRNQGEPPPAFQLTRCALRASRAFRDPSFDERFLRGPSLIPNPTLGVEDGWWVDLGCHASLHARSQRLTLSAIAFEQRYEPLILYIPLDPYRVQASDSEGAEVRGLKLSARGRYFLPKPWPHLSFESQLTLQRHALTSAPYTPLPLRPTHLFWARLSAHLRPSELWLKLSERSALYADRFGLRTLEGARFIDLGVGRTWRLNAVHQARFDVSMRNALGERASDLTLRPLPARSVWVSVRLEGSP
jgi:hypothetical protein